MSDAGAGAGSGWRRWGRREGRARDRADGGDARSGPTEPHDRALLAFTAIDAAFGVRRTDSLFRETTGRVGGRYAHLWPFSRVAAGALDLAELGLLPVERAESMLGPGLDCYRRGEVDPPGYDSAVRPPLGPGGDRYYDDNAWIGLDLVRLHELTGDEHVLRRAQEVFAFLVSGWDVDPRAPHPGGVAWVEGDWNRDRNTVSTAPAAHLGFLLAGQAETPTGVSPSSADGRGERTWAERMLAWVRGALRDPTDGLYWDHLDDRGTIERTKWSYNQGNVVGAELAEGSAAGLERAVAVAVAALDHYEARPDGLDGQGLAFNAIFLRNLVDLRARVGGDLGARVAVVLTGYADRAWLARCDDRGLVRPGRGGGAGELLDQAAMVELQALAASVGAGVTGPAGDRPPSSDRPPTG